MKRILITGTAGFIGSTAVDTLLAKGHTVLGVDNFSPQYAEAIKRRNVSTALKNTRFQLHETDIRNHESTAQLLTQFSPDAVVHIAGSTGMKTSFARTDEFHSNNVSGTLSLLEACRRAGVPQIVFLSTATVYGETARPAIEDSPLPPPLNPYVATKLIAEDLVRSYALRHGLQATILRSVTVYGPRQRPGMGISSFIEQLADNRPVTVYGDGSANRDYLYVDDCVSAICAALDRPLPCETINIGSGEVTSLTNLVAILAKLTGSRPMLSYRPTPAGIPLSLTVDTGRAHSLLGFTAAVPLRVGLSRTVTVHESTNTIAWEAPCPELHREAK